MSRKRPDPAELEARIGHRFSDKTLLVRALTHVSAAPGSGARRDSYQRLEFLGDRVLGLSVADLLIRTFPDASEGDLNPRFAELVRRETCTDVATHWDVSPHIRIGGGEAASGVRRNPSVLADVCEAIIGAIYLDAGFVAAQAAVEQAFGPRLQSAGRPKRDAKTLLQEWAQGRGLPPPLYRIVERSGPDHAPSFVVEASVAGVEPARGDGASKRDAEQAAARAMLERERVVAETADV